MLTSGRQGQHGSPAPRLRLFSHSRPCSLPDPSLTTTITLYLYAPYWTHSVIGVNTRSVSSLYTTAGVTGKKMK